MKKIIAMLMLSVMLVSFASCGAENADGTSSTSSSMQETQQTTEQTTDTMDEHIGTAPILFVSPSDERETAKTIVKENEDGIRMEITLYGYASEKLGKEFYVKHDEYVTADVTITNGSDGSYYQTVPTFCVEGRNPHRHEIDVDLADKDGHKLTINSAYEACPEMLYTWELKAGESDTFRLDYVVGETDFDFRTGKRKVSDFALYDGSIYTNGVCEFSGSISFGYFEPIDIVGQMNDREISADVSIEVVYAERSEPATAFTRPTDEERVYKAFTTQNEDLELKTVFEVHGSESLGEDAYFLRTENIYGYFYVTNTSDHSVYFYLRDPIEIVGFSEPSEFIIDLKSTDGCTLDYLKGYQGFDAAIDRIELKPGEMFMRSLRFAAGEYVSGYYVDENGNDCYTDGGFRYYGADAYKDGKMRFGGTVSFDYFESSEAEEVTGERKTIKTDISLVCFYEAFEDNLD